MNDITRHLVKTLLPYVVCFLMGVIVAWKGCGDTSSKPITTIIEKPVPTIEYVDRWKTDTVRFVKTRIKYDTITVERWGERIVLDTLFLIDTVKIVDTWLTEVVHYDTTAPVGGGALRLQWQNYQNLSENLVIDYLPKKVVSANFALGVHGNAGLISDFRSKYVPLMGIGVQATVKRSYFSIDYGFNGDHYVGIRAGRNIISK
jgi:hypothetical protein